jgi:hypothetical protein
MIIFNEGEEDERKIFRIALLQSSTWHKLLISPKKNPRSKYPRMRQVPLSQTFASVETWRDPGLHQPAASKRVQTCRKLMAVKAAMRRLRHDCYSSLSTGRFEALFANLLFLAPQPSRVANSEIAVVLVELIFGMMVAAVVLLLPFLLMMIGVGAAVLLWFVASAAQLGALVFLLVFPGIYGLAVLLPVLVIGMLLVDRRSRHRAP